MRDPQELEQVKAILKELAQIAPGHAVEVRIPPYAAIQCVEGPKHTRGTPSSVVEMNAATLFDLVSGGLKWESGVSNGQIHASGERCNLESLYQQVTNRMQP